MGDRCYFTVLVRSEDARSEKGAAILRSFFDTHVNPDNIDGPCEIWIDESMNYGGDEFLEEWSKTGFLAEFFQSGGAGYGPSKMICGAGVCANGDYWEVQTGHGGNGFVIDLDEEGRVIEGTLQEAREFMEASQKVRQALMAGPLEQLAEAGEKKA